MLYVLAGDINYPDGFPVLGTDIFLLPLIGKGVSFRTRSTLGKSVKEIKI
jgi:hypothetical protein